MKILNFILLFLSTGLLAQTTTFTNPILPGGFPDPSICRVGEDYYIVNSSFEYFPGLPIHHSKDLVNWELVGYGLHREDQVNKEVNLVDVNSNGGIHAPTIRFHDGLFYIITTNVYYDEENEETDFVNFIITAKDIKGPWSQPHVLEGAPGIDPDIFFDEDGKVWYVGTRSPENPNFQGEGEIWLQEIDLVNWKLIGERIALWRGACGGVWVEGPHMYKKDGRYYLLVAEGGTGYDHAVMIAVSDNITGPYLSNARNPILSSRHLSYDNWVNSTGHADLIELPDGRWYMVALGVRGDEQRGSNMGRETHLIPVRWEREPYEWKEVKHEWPVVAPLTGRVERHTPLPFSEKPQHRNIGFTDNFDTQSLDLQWNFRRVPKANTYSLSARKGYLRLFASSTVIKERGQSSLMGVRQGESDFEYSVSMEFSPTQTDTEAGISLFQKDDNYLNFTIKKTANSYYLQLILAEPGKSPRVLKKQELGNYDSKISFKVSSKNNIYQFDYQLGGQNNYTRFNQTAANLILSKGYTGAYLGFYSSSNGKVSNDYADFDWISYKGYQR